MCRMKSKPSRQLASSSAMSACCLRKASRSAMSPAVASLAVFFQGMQQPLIQIARGGGFWFLTQAEADDRSLSS